MLGLFDSGLGGLTVLRRLREELPEHDTIFFADQANVPYGDRSSVELRALLTANLARLDAAGAEAVVMACNTSCAIAAEYGWPVSRAHIIDLIDSAAAAVQRHGYRNVGVIATAATARSGAYGRRIKERIHGAQVTEVAAPALVPLVERGMLQGPIPRAAVAQVCAQFPCDVDAVVLACTHYPLLAQHFRHALGEHVELLDPAIEHVARTVELVAHWGIAPGRGELTCVTSGDPELFSRHVSAALASSAQQIAQA